MIAKNVVLAILFACILCSCKSDKPEAPQSDTVEDIYTFADKLCGKGDYVEAAKWLLIAAEHGHALSQLRLGKCFYFGEGVNEDKAQAVVWFGKAAQQGLADAQAYLGCCYECGNGVSRDYVRAAYWYNKAAEQNNPTALKNMGYLYKNGWGVERDYDKALELIGRSGHQRPELNIAYNMVARVFNLDRGNYSGARHWYTKTAEADNPHGQYMLGRLYYYGMGAPQNYELAVYWFMKSANTGYAWGQFYLAKCYEDGNGVPQDHTKAFELNKMAAVQHLTEAEFTLAYSYSTGTIGAPVDYGKAVYWYTRIAKKGNAEAQYNVGMIYLDHYRKNELAVYWLRKAAMQDLAEAQYYLGLCFLNGTGVVRNEGIAVDWLGKAAEQGLDEAKKMLDIIKKHNEAVRQQSLQQNQFGI